jgi:cytochrome c-type biogenesis protein CcmF
VFPLLVEAVQDRQTIVGAPYFDSLTMPLGLVMLFLMGVAPVLPWRKASGELLRERLFWPAAMGVACLVLAVVVGADGWAPLVAFGLAGFAGGAALRQLALATRRQGWRGFVGRANGGMVVHLGVIMIAVALAASNSFTHSATLELSQGEVVTWGDHTFELLSVTEQTNDRESERVLAAQVRLDGGSIQEPAITTYLNIGQDIGTPAVDTGFVKDVYLTLEPGTEAGATTATIRAFVKPMIMWLWLGGLLMAIGTVLAAFPGSRRRRPTDPVSAPIPIEAAEETDGAPEEGAPVLHRPDDQEPDRAEVVL